MPSITAVPIPQTTTCPQLYYSRNPLQGTAGTSWI